MIANPSHRTLLLSTLESALVACFLIQRGDQTTPLPEPLQQFFNNNGVQSQIPSLQNDAFRSEEFTKASKAFVCSIIGEDPVGPERACEVGARLGVEVRVDTSQKKRREGRFKIKWEPGLRPQFFIETVKKGRALDQESSFADGCQQILRIKQPDFDREETQDQQSKTEVVVSELFQDKMGETAHNWPVIESIKEDTCEQFCSFVKESTIQEKYVCTQPGDPWPKATECEDYKVESVPVSAEDQEVIVKAIDQDARPPPREKQYKIQPRVQRCNDSLDRIQSRKDSLELKIQRQQFWGRSQEEKRPKARPQLLNQVVSRVTRRQKQCEKILLDCNYEVTVPFRINSPRKEDQEQRQRSRVTIVERKWEVKNCNDRNFRHDFVNELRQFQLDSSQRQYTQKQNEVRTCPTPTSSFPSHDMGSLVTRSPCRTAQLSPTLYPSDSRPRLKDPSLQFDYFGRALPQARPQIVSRQYSPAKEKRTTVASQFGNDRWGAEPNPYFGRRGGYEKSGRMAASPVKYTEPRDSIRELELSNKYKQYRALGRGRERSQLYSSRRRLL